MNPQDAKTIADFLLANLEYEITATQNVLRAVPAERMDYRPDAKSRTGLGLVRHMTVEDVWFLNAIADGGHGAMPPSDGAECGIDTPEQGAARYGEQMAHAIARVRAMSGEQLAESISLFGGAWTMPAVQFLSLVLRHSAHHRGQLSAYLRAMGSKVPSIYGPSADTTPVMA